MKYSKNLTKRHIYSRIPIVGVIFLGFFRRLMKWPKKMHSGIFNVSSLLVSPNEFKKFGTTASARRRISMKSMKKSLGSFGGRFAATISILAAALVLTACGGGGGGSATTPAITPPVQLTQSIVLFALPVAISGQSVVNPPNIPVNTVVAVEFTPVNFVNATAASFTVATGTGATFSCNGVRVNTASLAAFTIAPVSETSKFTASASLSMAGLPNAVMCTFSVPVTVVSGGVTSSTVPITFSFTTAAATCAETSRLNALGICIPPPATTGYTWNAGLGAWVANVGVKVIGTNELPAGCTYWEEKCWKDSVANGTVKFIATPALMIGYNNRPVVFAYYRLYSTIFKANQWNYLPIYADDGSLVGSNIFGGISQEVDFAQGSAKGVIIHEKSTGDCYERAWDSTQKSWSVNGGAAATPTTCPN